MSHNIIGLKSEVSGLSDAGIKNTGVQHWNMLPTELVEETIKKGQGSLAWNGALCVNTGEFTGRSPKDKFVVKDSTTEDSVWWGSVNQPISPEKFESLLAKVQAFLQGKDLYIRDVFAGADPEYRLNVRVINALPWQNLFVNNLFIRPDREALKKFRPDWTVIAAPGFFADPEIDGTRQHNFTMVNFTKRIVLIGGSAYTGEIKKGIFTVMNYVLPMKGVLSMHCSANIGKEGDTSVFFGLSGTGKTTLSADPDRGLIGDDEHGWTENTVFNFEGGCYAKCIDLSEEKEEQIWHAIRHGALVENTNYHQGTRMIDFQDSSITENTRVAYPIDFIKGAVEPSVGPIPKNIFFLTCDAFGVLPPLSKLTPGQAMYQFISGYTAKVAGTEAGITEPKLTFSACFGEPFLPLHPTKYAEMLGEKIKRYQTNVWLVNTGWTGGPYGVGSRMSLKYTRAMITAVLNGQLKNAKFKTDPIFGLSFPTEVPGVPSEVLNPRNTWENKASYDEKANSLAISFNKNFEKYSEFANEEILAAAPRALTT
jgi:phosphoenolpyruvate carboxykinase (ATP)